MLDLQDCDWEGDKGGERGKRATWSNLTGYRWVASINFYTGGCISTHGNTGENDFTHTYTRHPHAYTGLHYTSG